MLNRVTASVLLPRHQTERAFDSKRACTNRSPLVPIFMPQNEETRPSESIQIYSKIGSCSILNSFSCILENQDQVVPQCVSARETRDASQWLPQRTVKYWTYSTEIKCSLCQERLN